MLFGATLDHAELLTANLRGVDLTQASARGTGFGGADLEGANLFNATLTGATFTQANLTGVDARTADVTGARLRECCLRDADCSQSVLCDTDLGESDVQGATFERADLRRSKLSGLRGAPKRSGSVLTFWMSISAGPILSGVTSSTRTTCTSSGARARRPRRSTGSGGQPQTAVAASCAGACGPPLWPRSSPGYAGLWNSTLVVGPTIG